MSKTTKFVDEKSQEKLQYENQKANLKMYSYKGLQRELANEESSEDWKQAVTEELKLRSQNYSSVKDSLDVMKSETPGTVIVDQPVTESTEQPKGDEQ